MRCNGVAGRQGGGGHPQRDRDREVPRRDDAGDAARQVAQVVALARDLEEGVAAVQPKCAFFSAGKLMVTGGVQIGPGATALTRIPCSATSRASPFVKVLIAR